MEGSGRRETVGNHADHPSFEKDLGEARVGAGAEVEVFSFSKRLDIALEGGEGFAVDMSGALGFSCESGLEKLKQGGAVKRLIHRGVAFGPDLTLRKLG